MLPRTKELFLSIGSAGLAGGLMSLTLKLYPGRPAGLAVSKKELAEWKSNLQESRLDLDLEGDLKEFADGND